MIHLPITYVDFDGKQRTREFYFNLTKGDIVKISLVLPGGLEGFMERLKDEPSAKEVVEVFEKIIFASYGKRTPDGKFTKNPEYVDEFAASDAYSELLLKFLDNEDGFADKFLEGVMNVTPEELRSLSETPEFKSLKAGMADDE